MKRRDFIKYTAPALAAPVILNGMPINAIAKSPMFNALMAAPVAASERVLVIVQLNGGNDGLNTILPIDQYTHLSQPITQGGRQNILIPEAAGLKLELGGVDQYAATRLNPGMTSFKQLFSDEKLGIIQGVGYQNPDFSHFRSTDIWLTGSDSFEYLDTGWAGRQLNNHYPNYYANPTRGPLAITIGSASSLAFLSPAGDMGLSVENPTAGKSYFAGNNDVAPNSWHGFELDYLRGIIDSANTFGTAIKTAYDGGANMATYPDNYLAYQLKMVARLVSGGLGTRIYLVNAGGFDTHTDQVNANNTAEGYHNNLWRSICDSVAAFQNDLSLLTDSAGNSLEEKVTGFTFSEFGRTIKSNSTTGTDHGTTGPMFLFGKYVNPLIIGQNPEIYDSVNGEIKADLDLQFDYRSVYASLLYQYFKLPVSDINAIFNKTFQDGTSPGQDILDGGFHCNLPIFKPGSGLLSHYPVIADAKLNKKGNIGSQDNIQVNAGQISLKLEEGEVLNVSVLSITGQVISNKVVVSETSAYQNINMETTGLSSGVYIYQVKSNHRNISKQVYIP